MIWKSYNTLWAPQSVLCLDEIMNYDYSTIIINVPCVTFHSPPLISPNSPQLPHPSPQTPLPTSSFAFPNLTTRSTRTSCAVTKLTLFRSSFLACSSTCRLGNLMLSVLGSIFSTAFSLPLPLSMQSEVLGDGSGKAGKPLQLGVEERDGPGWGWMVGFSVGSSSSRRTPGGMGTT